MPGPETTSFTSPSGSSPSSKSRRPHADVIRSRMKAGESNGKQNSSPLAGSMKFSTGDDFYMVRENDHEKRLKPLPSRDQIEGKAKRRAKAAMMRKPKARMVASASTSELTLSKKHLKEVRENRVSPLSPFGTLHSPKRSMSPGYATKPVGFACTSKPLSKDRIRKLRLRLDLEAKERSLSLVKRKLSKQKAALEAISASSAETPESKMRPGEKRALKIAALLSKSLLDSCESNLKRKEFAASSSAKKLAMMRLSENKGKAACVLARDSLRHMRYNEAHYYANQAERLFFNSGTLMMPHIIQDLENLERELHGAPILHASAISIERIARGFIIRNAIQKVENEKRRRAAVRMQSFSRRVLSARIVREKLRAKGKAKRYVMQIQVTQARNLAKADLLGKSDPYVVIYYKLRGRARIKIGQTKVVKRTLSPVWKDETFKVTLPRRDLLDRVSITAVVRDKDMLRKGSFLGRVRFSGKRQLLGLSSTETFYALVKDPKRSAKQNAKVSGELALSSRCEERVVDVADVDDDEDTALGENSVTSESSEEEEERSRETTSVAIRLFAASGLGKADLLGKSDPYCKVFVNNEMCSKSSVCKNTLSPRWNDRLAVRVPKQTNVKDELRIEVWDRDTVGSGEFLGQYVVRGNQVAASNLIKEYAVRQKLPLGKKPNGRPQKCVKLGAMVEFLFEEDKKQDSALHVLLLSIHSAKDLAKTDMFGKSDPYVEVFLNDELVAVTKVVKKTLNPKFEEEFEIHVPAAPEASDELRLVVLDKDLIGSDDFLGQVVFPCKNIKTMKPSSFDLEKSSSIPAKKQKHVKGSIQASFQLIKETPDAYAKLMTSQMSKASKRTFVHRRDDQKEAVEEKLSEPTTVGGQIWKLGKDLVTGGDKKKRNSVAKGRPKMKMRVNVVCAEDLAKADTFGKSDPFVKIAVNGVPFARTKVVKKTLSPVFGEEFELTVPVVPEEGDSLLFEVFDYDVVGSNDFLGRVFFGLESFTR